MTTYRISEIPLPLGAPEGLLRRLAAQRLRVSPDRIASLELARRSVDARKKNDVHFICTVECTVDGPALSALCARLPDVRGTHHHICYLCAGLCGEVPVKESGAFFLGGRESTDG